MLKATLLGAILALFIAGMVLTWPKDLAAQDPVDVLVGTGDWRSAEAINDAESWGDCRPVRIERISERATDLLVEAGWRGDPEDGIDALYPAECQD